MGNPTQSIVYLERFNKLSLNLNPKSHLQNTTRNVRPKPRSPIPTPRGILRKATRRTLIRPGRQQGYEQQGGEQECSWGLSSNPAGPLDAHLKETMKKTETPDVK